VEVKMKRVFVDSGTVKAIVIIANPGYQAPTDLAALTALEI
jgi:hypothetical protein